MSARCLAHRVGGVASEIEVIPSKTGAIKQRAIPQVLKKAENECSAEDEEVSPATQTQ